MEERKYTKKELEEVEKITKEFQEIQRAKRNQWKVNLMDFLATYGWAIAIVLIALMVILLQK